MRRINLHHFCYSLSRQHTITKKQIFPISNSIKRQMEKDPHFQKELQEESSVLKTFKGYTSIELVSNNKFVNRIYQSKFEKEDILWVATQKIHGANFSIHYDCAKNLVKYGRRKDFISRCIPVSTTQIQQNTTNAVSGIGEYFTENFYDAWNLVSKFHNHLGLINTKICKLYEKPFSFHIYGEYFGGTYPGVKPEKCQKRVQPGVYYTPNHEFMAFDIKICFKDYNEWVKVTDIPEILVQQIKCVPIYCQGSLQEIMKEDSQFNSTIPQILGLKKVEDNICEGLIIRPNKNLHTSQRVILKKKNKEFLEKVGGNYKAKNPKEKLDKTQASPQLEFLEAYLNENRVESAISKFPDYKDRYHLKGMVMEDIMTDAIKDGYEAPQASEVAQQVNREFDKIVITFVTNYLNKKPIIKKQ